MLSLAAIGLVSVGGVMMDDGIAFGTVYQAAMAYLPAMWIMIGIAVLFVGMVPKLTSLTWLYLTFSFISFYLGELFQFPEWVSKLSPFGHISQLPVEDMNFMKASILTLLLLESWWWALLAIISGILRGNRWAEIILLKKEDGAGHSLFLY